MEGRACRERDTFGYLRRYTLGLGLLWTLVIAALTVYSFLSFRQRALGDALVRGRQECSTCHAQQGCREGVLPGGHGISLPVENMLASTRAQALVTSAAYLGLWLFGAAGLRLGESRLRQQILATQRSHRLRRRVHQRLAHLAQHDQLTGLPNRTLFRDRLRLALAVARRFDGRVAVAVLGLDHFRAINHSYGHATGDLVLREAAARLTGCLRADDTVARLGNGRFLLLFPQIRHCDDGARLARKIQETFSSPFIANGRDLYLTASLGLAMYPEDGGEENELLRNADAALSRAQDQGVSVFQLYTASMNEHAMVRITLENQLRRALQLDQLSLRYQPQIDVCSGAIIGAEALIRWHHPELGEIPPDQFIPVAEESGQIFAIGEWVLREACREAARWQDLVGRPLPVAVNLSPRQFRHAGLVHLIEVVLKETGLAPECLELEIVESSVIHDIDRTIETLTDLKVRGIKVAVDDFGTGYSSLNYLKQLPIDRIKIDHSFVRDLELGRNDAALVGLIVELARKMGLDTLAEGVETPAQRDVLQACRCHLMQGYLFSPPVTAEAFSALLRSASGSFSRGV
jgi:polar amino acid transport system substrate-binding protein